MKLSRGLGILGSLTDPEPMFVLLDTNLVDNVLGALLVDDRRLAFCGLISVTPLDILIGLDVIQKPFVLVSHLDEKLFDLSEGLDLDVLELALEVGGGDVLLDLLLLGGVRVVGDSSPSGEGVVHGELELQVTDFPLLLLEQDRWVELDVDPGSVGHLHHSRSELESRDRLLEVLGLGPDIGYHDRLAVATD